MNKVNLAALLCVAAPVTHRIVVIDRDGLLLSGDNAPRSEPGYRVTASNYIGEVKGIYRVKT